MDTTISVEQLRPEFAELLEKSEKIGGSNKPMIEVVSPEEAKHMVLNMSDFLVGEGFIILAGAWREAQPLP